MDLGAIIDFLNLQIEKDKKRISDDGSQNGFFRNVFSDLYEQRITIAEDCKEKLVMVKAFLEKFAPDSYAAANIGNYATRRLTSRLEILKYRTELTKTKRALETLLFISKTEGDTERRKKCEECLDHLRHVYTALAKIKN